MWLEDTSELTLTGTRILVTGGAQGIGAGIAERALRLGAQVTITDRDDAKLTETVAALDGLGEIRHVVGDVTVPADVTKIVASAAAAMGGLDVLVNNAAISDASMVRTGLPTVEEFELVQSVNVRAVYAMSVEAVPYLAASGRGSIVNAASIASSVARPLTVAYATSKAAIGGLTRSLALEFAPMGVRVNAYAPGMIRTPMAESYLATMPDPEMAVADILDNYLTADLGAVSDVASVVCFLASSAARFVNGAVWAVDGGFTAFKATRAERQR